jgi:hypothetical protein
MLLERTQQQMAFDGIRVAWSSRVYVPPIQRTSYPIDGVVRRVVPQVSKKAHHGAMPGSVLTSYAVQSYARVARSMQGVRLPFATQGARA